tara:strand:+ start:5257 stop:5967 length:711 start_codon:yes stop_codon:yes gene_type:complete
MNLVICLHGIIGGSKGKNGKGEPWDPKVLYEHIYYNVVEPNKLYYDKINFIIHSWSTKQKEKILEHYNPIKYCIEKSSLKCRRRSKLLSLYKSIQLCDMQLSDEDVMLHTRFDNFYNKPLILDPLHIKKEEAYIADDPPKWDSNPEKYEGRVCDNFFFGYGKQFFNNFNSKKYEEIDNFIVERNPKVLKSWWLKKNKSITDNHMVLSLVLKDFNIIKLDRGRYKSKVDIQIFREKK